MMRERTRLTKIYNHLYRIPVKCEDYYKCMYCGIDRQCLDHVPPLSTIENIDINEYKKDGGKFLLIPSCLKCNQFLGFYNSNSMYDRINLLISKYNKKLKKRPIWTEEELSEMSDRFLQYHFAKDDKYRIIENKLKHLYTQLINRDFEDLY